MEQNINIELENISTWLKVNKLSLNIGKTHYMIVDKQKRRSIQLEIKIENQGKATFRVVLLWIWSTYVEQNPSYHTNCEHIFNNLWSNSAC